MFVLPDGREILAADSAQAWRTLTRTDVEAHYHLLKENHPASRRLRR